MTDLSFIPIAKPAISEKEHAYVQEALASGFIAEGPFTRKLETEFSKTCGTKNAIAVSSGTAALHITLMAHDIGKGDEVITTPFSFAATINSILYTGAMPVFVDINEKTFNLNTALIEEKITEKTKALLPVHLYGHPCDMDEIERIAKKYNLAIIEDAAQAIGSSYKNKPIGGFGTACFSMYATKNITCGEGGMITTDDDDIAAKCRLLRNHGMKERYKHEILGYNLRTNDVCAAIGCAQMERRKELQEKRNANARYFTKNIKGVILPTEEPDCVHVWHQYTIRFLKGRDIALEKLKEKGIGATIFYPSPMYKQPYIQNIFNEKPYAPVTEKICGEVLCIPVHPLLSDEERNRIVDAVNSL